jgi:hypothetical protein
MQDILINSVTHLPDSVADQIPRSGVTSLEAPMSTPTAYGRTGPQQPRQGASVSTTDTTTKNSDRVLARLTEALDQDHAKDVLIQLLGTLSGMSDFDHPISPADLADQAVRAIAEGIATAIRPKDRVLVYVNDLGADLMGTVTEVYRDAIGCRTAKVELPNGRIFPQATRFLERVGRPAPPEVLASQCAANATAGH